MIAAMGSTVRAGTGPGGAVRLLVLGPFAIEVEGAPDSRRRGQSAARRGPCSSSSRWSGGHVVAVDRVARGALARRATGTASGERGPARQPAAVVARTIRRRGRSTRLRPRALTSRSTWPPPSGSSEMAERALASGHAGVALVPPSRPALLWGGAVLEDAPYAAWAEPARREQAGLLRRARLAHAGAALAAGEPAGLPRRRSPGSPTPLDEEMGRRLMAAYGAPGSRPGPSRRTPGCGRRSRTSSAPTRRPRRRPCTSRCCAVSRCRGRARWAVPRAGCRRLPGSSNARVSWRRCATPGAPRSPAGRRCSCWWARPGSARPAWPRRWPPRSRRPAGASCARAATRRSARSSCSRWSMP